MTHPKLYAVTLAALITTVNFAGAQTHHSTDHAQSKASSHSAFHKEMQQSMTKMHEAMTSAPMTGNPDIDFAEMMIPHHQGAIDMARIQLKHGKDPELRALAEQIIAAQEKEIAEMHQRIQHLQKKDNPTSAAPHQQ